MPTEPLGDSGLNLTASGINRIFRSAFFAPTEKGADDLRADPLIAEWEELARRTAALPFLRAQWLIAWWRAFGRNDEHLQIWILRRNERIAALLPLIRQGGNLRSATNYHTPQSGLLAESDEAGEALVRALLRDGGANETVLAGLDSLSHDPDLCDRAARSTGHNTLMLPHARSCFLSLKEGWAAYEARLGGNMSRDMQWRRRRLQELGPLAVDVNDGRANLSDLLDTVLALEATGWRRRKGTAILSDPRVERFYRDVARWAAAEGSLRLCFLRVDGKPLAMQLVLEHQRTWHLLKFGYDERYDEAAPGKVLLHDCIRHCADAGMTRMELHGASEAYKLSWGPQCRDMQRIHLFPASVPGRLAWAHLALQAWLKAWGLRLHLLQQTTMSSLHERADRSTP